MQRSHHWLHCLAVICLAATSGAVVAEDPPPGEEIIVNDGTVTESAPDYVEVTGDGVAKLSE